MNTTAVITNKWNAAVARLAARVKARLVEAPMQWLAREFVEAIDFQELGQHVSDEVSTREISDEINRGIELDVSNIASDIAGEIDVEDLAEKLSAGIEVHAEVDADEIADVVERAVENIVRGVLREQPLPARVVLERREHDERFSVVLVKLTENRTTPYVVWFERKEDGSTSHGDYCIDLAHALDAFNMKGL